MKIYEKLDNGITIVEYEDSLAPALADMWNRSRDDWGGDTGIKTAVQVKARIAGNAMYNIYVAMDGDVAVGYCDLGRYFGDADTLYVNLLSVRPDYQGKKIGKALVLRCMERTIELGYPRIDLHTWGGNTAAVPLYKKCGYLWEDRADSTHLVNFIPSILNTPLFADFFKKADWYAHSTRSLDIVPDGVKVNKFEVFGYSWEKDGEILAIGFERTGRQMRLIETNDYKMEWMAEDHELAFGLDYNCTFTVENKTGNPLHVKISGRDDKNIKFDYNLDTNITGTQTFTGKFHVGAIDEPQNIWKVHPCLLADVEINGEKVVFGLGIESRFPITVTLTDESKFQQVGMETTMHIGIKSALTADAVVEFTLPENSIADFTQKSYAIDITANGKNSMATTVKYKTIGYESLPIEYKIKLKNGTAFSLHRPLHFFSQDIAHAFAREDDYEYAIVNGAWGVCLSKKDNEAKITHLTNQNYSGWLGQPKLGKPYDDEFNLIKPTVKSYQQGMDMIMEAEFISEKFKGMVVTQIFTLSPVGIISRKHRIENRGESNRKIMLNDRYGFPLGNKTIFRYEGKFTQNHNSANPDGARYGIDDINLDQFEENWLFEASTSGARGVCWSPMTKPILQWGDFAIFEIDAGEIAPRQIFETQPIVFAYGIFDNFSDFRSFALKKWEQVEEAPTPPIEIKLNDFNPFMRNDIIHADINNKRVTNLAGRMTIDSPSQLFESASTENPDAEVNVHGNTFELTIVKQPSTIAFANIRMQMAAYEKTVSRALFFSKGQVTCHQEGSIYTVSNGEITFKADPKYGNACYSLTHNGHEWLKNQYPEHKPFAWWNIFTGGIEILPPNMNNNAILKEKITASFVKIPDCYGNQWNGIRTILNITEDEALRGAVYESYFVTLPGLPLLCSFYRFINGTGMYQKDVVEFSAYLNVSENVTDAFADIVDKAGQTLRLHFGTSDMEVNFDTIAKLSGKRKESLYFFHNNIEGNDIANDSKMPIAVNANMEAPAAPSKTFTSSPSFFLITEADIPKGALDDLGRLHFKNAEVLT